MEARVAYSEEALPFRDRVRGTAYELGLAAAAPVTLNASQFGRDMRCQCEGLPIDESAWTQIASGLALLDIPQWQLFTTFCFMTPASRIAHGPVWVSQRWRATAFAATGRQRAPASNTRGVDYLLPAGLTPAAHMQLACVLPNRLRGRA